MGMFSYIFLSGCFSLIIRLCGSHEDGHKDWTVEAERNGGSGVRSLREIDYGKVCYLHCEFFQPPPLPLPCPTPNIFWLNDHLERAVLFSFATIIIKSRFLLRALDMYWHEDCLKCGCCDCRLGEVGSTLYTRANLILCRRDYLRYHMFFIILLWFHFNVNHHLEIMNPILTTVLTRFHFTVKNHLRITQLDWSQQNLNVDHVSPKWPAIISQSFFFSGQGKGDRWVRYSIIDGSWGKVKSHDDRS